MNDPFDKLRDVLERITAAEDERPTDLDPAEQSLREAWLEFGRMLEAVQPSEEITIEPWKQPVRSGSRGRRWLVPMAIAASLLVVAISFWSIGRQGEKTPVPATIQNNIAINTEPASLVQETQSSRSADEMQWSDSLDEEIARIGERMMYANQDDNASMNSRLVQCRIESMWQEFSQEDF